MKWNDILAIPKRNNMARAYLKPFHTVTWPHLNYQSFTTCISELIFLPNFFISSLFYILSDFPYYQIFLVWACFVILVTVITVLTMITVITVITDITFLTVLSVSITLMQLMQLNYCLWTQSCRKTRFIQAFFAGVVWAGYFRHIAPCT